MVWTINIIIIVHTGNQPAGRTFVETDLRVLGTPS